MKKTFYLLIFITIFACNKKDVVAPTQQATVSKTTIITGSWKCIGTYKNNVLDIPGTDTITLNEDLSGMFNSSDPYYDNKQLTWTFQNNETGFKYIVWFGNGVGEGRLGDITKLDTDELWFGPAISEKRYEKITWMP